MKASWKERKGLNPEIILSKISSFTTVQEHAVSFKDFEHYSVFPVLETMIDFPPTVPELERENLLRKSIVISAQNNCINDKTKVLKYINSEITTFLNTVEKRFHLLSKLSVVKPLPNNQIIVDGIKIRFLNGNFPKKYKSRNSLIADKVKDYKNKLNLYTNVITTTESRSPLLAATKCIRALDILRAVWCLGTNSVFELFGGKPGVPINNIRIGIAQTIHKENGQIATKAYWFDPNFEISKPYNFHSIKGFKKTI